MQTKISLSRNTEQNINFRTFDTTSLHHTTPVSTKSSRCLQRYTTVDRSI